jgi:uncharacterized lipoprotein
MWRLICVVFLALLGAACSGERTLSCVDTERYESSVTRAPIRVPDDLTPPDESDGLVIPQVSTTELSDAAPQGCLEAPPGFYEQEPVG